MTVYVKITEFFCDALMCIVGQCIVIDNQKEIIKVPLLWVMKGSYLGFGSP